MTATEEVNIQDILTATEDAIEKAAAERRKELEEREKSRLEEIHDLDAIIKDILLLLADSEHQLRAELQPF